MCILWSNYESRTAICHIIIANKLGNILHHSFFFFAFHFALSDGLCGNGFSSFVQPHNSRTVNNWVNSCYILFWIHTAHLYNCEVSWTVSLACLQAFFRLLIIIWWCLDSSTADAIRWWAVLNACVEKKNNNINKSARRVASVCEYEIFRLLAILIYENEKEMFNNSTLLCFIALPCVAFYTYIHFGRTSNANYFRFVIYSERTEEEEPSTRK